MQPLQYDLRCPAVKDRRITHAAAAASNPSTPGATFVRENIAFRAIPNIHANITFPKQFQCDLQSLPCKSQKNCVDQGCKHLHEVAITTRSEHLNRTLQWGTRPSASRTRRTTEVSPIDAGSDVVRENKGFRAIPNGQTSPELSNSTAICQITLQLQHASMNHPDITRTLPHLYCVTPLLFSPSLISPHPYYLHLY